MTCQRRCLQFRKGGHRYVFVYPEGRESEVIASFISLADDPASEFDWLDAAALSFETGRQHEQPRSTPVA